MSITTASWTSFLDPRLTLKDIIIPMSHDSATASLSDRTFSRREFQKSESNKITQTALATVASLKFSRKIIMDMAITQNPVPGISFITEQMNLGIRAFDLRIYCGEDDENWIKYQHGAVVWDTNVLETFYHVANNFRFANEIMILRLSHFSGEESRNAGLIMRFLDKVQSIFNDKLCMRNMRDQSSFDLRTLAELRSTPIIFIIDVKLNSTELATMRSTYKWVHTSNSCYDDGYSLVKKLNVGMDADEVINYCYNSAKVPWTPKLYQTQMHLQMEQPEFKDIIKLNLPNIREETNKSGLNNNLLCVLDDICRRNQAREPGKRAINIVSFDFFTPQLIEKIININMNPNF